MPQQSPHLIRGVAVRCVNHASVAASAGVPSMIRSPHVDASDAYANARAVGRSVATASCAARHPGGTTLRLRHSDDFSTGACVTYQIAVQALWASLAWDETVSLKRSLAAGCSGRSGSTRRVGRSTGMALPTVMPAAGLPSDIPRAQLWPMCRQIEMPAAIPHIQFAFCAPLPVEPTQICDIRHCDVLCCGGTDLVIGIGSLPALSQFLV